MIGEILLFLVSLAVTLAAAAFFARRLDRVGLRLGLPETLLGLLTALAADAPEVSSAIAALVKGEHAVGAGVVLGSNVFNLAAMVGLSAVLCGGIRIRREALAVEGAVGVAATVVVSALILKLIGAWAALGLLVVVLVPYVVLLGLGPARAPRQLVRFFGERHRPDHVLAHGEAVLVPALMLVPALAIIVVGSTGMVESALNLANRWSVPDVIVGILVLAILTSIPNAFTAARLAFQGRGAAVVSETLNSNTTNLAFGIALPALFISIGSTSALTVFDLGWLLLMTLVTIALFARRGGVTRSGGVAILLLYAVFVVVQIASS
ncbi:MAG: sodium:calcium antiporter [Gaiellaceae bacterium]